jgi:hypothetical protein
MTATERSRAEAIAKSDKYSGAGAKNILSTLFLNRLMNGRGRGGGGGKSAEDWRNEVLAHRYKLEAEHEFGQQAADAAAKRTVDTHKQQLDTVIGGIDTLKKRHGGIPLSIKHGTTNINFGANHPGYGNGAQGTSTQQTKPGGRQSRTSTPNLKPGETAGQAAAAASATKSPTAAAVARQRKAASSYAMVMPNKSALPPETKAQNAAFRTY